LLLRSEEFGDAYWTKTNSTIGANVAVAPDGASTADKIIANNATGINANINRTNIVFSSSSAITFSVFVKQDGFTWSRIRLFDRRNSAGYNQFVNLAAGTLGAIPAGLTASIQAFSNGWYKVILSLPSIAGAPEIDVFVGSASSDGVVEVNGDGVLGILAWGAQLETGSVATSYIPTVATTQTRNADVIVDTAVSGLIGQTEGTLYAEVRLTQNTAGRRIFGISDGTASNRLAFTMGDMQIRTLKDGNTSLISSSTLAAGTYKIAIAYTNAEIVFYINGSLIGTSATSGADTYNRVDLGQTEANAAQFNDRISAAAIYTERLSNSELAQLTTL
jgi:hypothetical protein